MNLVDVRSFCEEIISTRLWYAVFLGLVSRILVRSEEPLSRQTEQGMWLSFDTGKRSPFQDKSGKLIWFEKPRPKKIEALFFVTKVLKYPGIVGIGEVGGADVTPRKYVFDVTSIGRRSSPWTCKLSESRLNFTSSASSIFLVHNLCCDKCI